MISEQPYAALGYRFRIATEHAPLARWMRRAFAPMTHTGAVLDAVEDIRLVPGRPRWRASSQLGDRLFQATPAMVVPELLVYLNRRIVTEAAGRALVLHAGVLEHRGQLVVLVAPSGAGKSTLVAEGARRGWAYGGDEHAAIQLANGCVTPVPKPIALKSGSVHLFSRLVTDDPALRPFRRRQLVLGTADLGAEVVRQPMVPSLIVLPSFRPGAATAIRAVGPAAALTALRAESFNFGVDPERSFRALAQLVRHAPTVTVRHGDAPSALNAISARIVGRTA